jgi:DNA-binding MarR family transcriptional regulator
MLDIEKGSLTALIDQLADYGLVNRSADPKDRRKTLITLSPNGKELITKMLDYHTRQISASLANSKSEEIDSFILNLRKAVEFMKKI